MRAQVGDWLAAYSQSLRTPAPYGRIVEVPGLAAARP